MGTQRRSRSCTNPAPKCGGTCGAGGTEESQQCQGKTLKCPVSGSWGVWGLWGGCSGTCYGAGTKPRRSRSRHCDSPAPSTDPPGDPCAGSDTDSQECPGLKPCPVDGAWGGWSMATPCSVTCGVGGVTLRRACNNPAPQHGGRACAGKDTRQGVCGPRKACPEELHWGPWSSWSPCARPFSESIRCKSLVGQQQRTRACVGHSQGAPLSRHGGAQHHPHPRLLRHPQLLLARELDRLEPLGALHPPVWGEPHAEPQPGVSAHPPLLQADGDTDGHRREQQRHLLGGGSAQVRAPDGGEAAPGGDPALPARPALPQPRRGMRLPVTSWDAPRTPNSPGFPPKTRLAPPPDPSLQ
ncbi:properdin isoform X1 [Myiozetetes cayanensis]|uniref:properdin isoform X1 n=1 Tax=Myiozetetes cayanensis TaxID=478635 RepID=UPI00215FCBBF|nr:properdin isoform X1 [Myiozetetes cayanensis]